MTHRNGSGDVSPRPVRILSVPDERPIIVRFLGPYLGLTTHYFQKQTHPCKGESRCPAAVHRAPTIWKGYAPVDEWSVMEEFWVAAVLEVTEGLEHLLTGRKLRGEVWTLSRVPERRHGPVLGYYSETKPEEDLRPTFSIIPILERAYHCDNLNLGVPNPVPRQVVLESHQSPAPKISAELIDPIPQEKPMTPQDRDKMRKQLRDFMKNGKAAHQ